MKPFTRGAGRRDVRRPHRLHRRGRLRDHAAGHARRAGILAGAARAGVKPCGLGARDTLRLEAGMNLYGNDMDETTTRSSPASPGPSRSSRRPRLHRPRGARGAARAGVKRSSSAWCSRTGGVLRGHQKVIVPDAGEGEITSGTFSPTLETRPSRWRACRQGHGERVAGRHPRQAARARVVKPPFVRNGKAVTVARVSPALRPREIPGDYRPSCNSREFPMSKIPADLKYAQSHEWVRAEPTARSRSASPTTRRTRSATWCSSSAEVGRTLEAARPAPWSSPSRPRRTSTARSPATVIAVNEALEARPS
jgi:hypothetical protein